MLRHALPLTYLGTRRGLSKKLGVAESSTDGEVYPSLKGGTGRYCACEDDDSRFAMFCVESSRADCRSRSTAAPPSEACTYSLKHLRGE
jgi:hypothetical protein